MATQRPTTPTGVPHVEVLHADGSLEERLDPHIPDQDLVRLVDAMILVRTYDERRLRLQRQGRIGTFAPTTGQEAAQLGSVFAVRRDDWVVPSFRETAVAVWRGMRLEDDLLFCAGFEEGLAIPQNANDLPICVPVASQLPHAVGLAWALKLRGSHQVVLAYFGDGATSEGDFHEAMNFAGLLRVPVVFLCQNNQWAISVPRREQTASATLAQKALAYGIPGVEVDGNDLLGVYRVTREAVERARAGNGATMIEAVTYRLGVHTTADDPKKYRSDDEVEAWKPRDPLVRLRKLLEDRGLVDEADWARREEQAAKRVDEAVKAFDRMEAPDPLGMFEHAWAALPPSLARQREELAHELGRYARHQRPERVDQGAASVASSTRNHADGDGSRGHETSGDGTASKGATMVEALNRALAEEMESDDRVLMLGEDVGRDGGIFRVTEGLRKRFGPERVVDTPVSEAGIVGTSIGLALGGMRPVAEMQFSGFSYFAFHQIESHLSRMRKRSRGRHTCPVVVRMPYGAGVRALEHHSESREAYYAHTPGLKVVIPSTPRNARSLLRAAIRDPDPVIFMEPKALYRKHRETLPEEPDPVDLGRSVVVREGEGLTLVAYGHMLDRSLEAAAVLEKEDGVRAEVVDVRTISPLDSDTIIRSIKKTGRAVVVHEAARSFGVAAEIVARVNDEALEYLEAPIRRVTGFDIHVPFFGREQYYLPGRDRILAGARWVLAYK